MPMLDTARRIVAGAVALAAAVTACSASESGPTTTRFIPPTSEVIFSLTTTTSTPPGPLDPVFVESLGITVDFPRDWDFRTDSLRFGRASAAFRADNGAGALIVVGAVGDIVPEGTPPSGATPDDLAPILATLLGVAEPLPTDAVSATGEAVEGTTADGTAYTLQAYRVTEASGSEASMEIAIYPDLDPAVFVAVLYEEGLPADRIEQTRVFDTVTAG